MGIRISKSLGYGLTDLQVDNFGSITEDPRINSNGFFGCEYGEDRYSVDGFFRYLKHFYDSLDDKSKHDYLGVGFLLKDYEEGKFVRADIFDFYDYDSEYGLSNVINFIPPGCADTFTRYDDSIDYYQEMITTSQLDASAHPIPSPIYPWLSWCDCRVTPPKRFTGASESLILRYIRARNDKSGKLGSRELSYLEEFAVRELGFENAEHLKKNVRPVVPEELVLLVKYLEVFNNEEDIYTLSPLLYSH